jgi:anti-sigma regulatory factor (Ser/Thr protein kinase)
MRESLSLIVRNDRSEIPRLAEVVADFCARNGLPDSLELELNLAVEEVIVNVMAHGYEDQCAHDIAVSFELNPGELAVRIEDDGLPFNPLEAPPVDLSIPAAQRRPGGLGIHFVKELMDSLQYRRDGNRNILTMKKRIAEQR